MKNLPTAGVLALAILGLSEPSRAASREPVLANLADLSLEQLTSITVTSASRREERLVEAPASIFVITADDIRRSGATSLPEVLRLAPNLHVARADNNQYAITARGFNNVLANKMLVLIDGRTVYTPLFSGVFWEAQDFLLDDVDRIEVISGPGATLWGANAVNGIINITTLAAARTQGLLMKGMAGSDERGALARYGGAMAGGHYRAYFKYFDRDNQRLQSGADIVDASRRAQAGWRADWGDARADEMLTLQGDAYWGDLEQLPEARKTSGANLLARWRRALSANSSLQVQAYYDRTDREHPMVFKEALDIFDFEAQHAIKRGAHMFLWGGGYRQARDRVENSASQAFIPSDRTLRWGNVFAQDEITIARGLTATLGIKAETNPYTGTEWLPNLRLAWQAAPAQLFWGALSRAVRAPSRLDREANIPGAPPFLLAGTDTFQSEVANVAEAGFRSQLSPSTSFSATMFYHDYPNLRSIRLASAGPTFANDIEGKVSGIEAWGSLRLAASWRLSGGFVVQDVRRRVKAGEVDLGGMSSLGNDPERSALLRSSWDITPYHDFDLAIRHVGKLPAPVLPAYTTVDARLAWRPMRGLEVSLTVQNLLDREHSEWGAAPNRAVYDRSFLLRAAWKVS